jgi:hypothetical protein
MVPEPIPEAVVGGCFVARSAPRNDIFAIDQQYQPEVPGTCSAVKLRRAPRHCAFDNALLVWYTLGIMKHVYHIASAGCGKPGKENGE